MNVQPRYISLKTCFQDNFPSYNFEDALNDYCENRDTLLSAYFKHALNLYNEDRMSFCKQTGKIYTSRTKIQVISMRDFWQKQKIKTNVEETNEERYTLDLFEKHKISKDDF